MKFFKLFGGSNPKKPESSSFSNIILQLTGSVPLDESWYQRALSHRSAQNARLSSDNFERLEFLGDSVIDLVIAEELMIQFPEETEGELTRMRAQLVNRKHLNSVAERIGLNQYILTDGAVNISKTSIPGNCLEALVGALYKDIGFDAAKTFVLTSVFDATMQASIQKQASNYKSQLLEWAQQARKKIQFEVTEQEFGENPAKRFLAQVIFEEKVIATGIGGSKKDASQEASAKAIEVLGISSV